MFLPLTIGNLNLKNPFLMSGNSLGIVAPEEWEMFYIQRAKSDVSGIVFPISEILTQNIDVVKHCLEELGKMGCATFLQMDAEEFKSHVKLVKELGFSGVVLETKSLDILPNDIGKDICVMLSIASDNKEMISQLNKIENNIHGIIMNFGNKKTEVEQMESVMTTIKEVCTVPVLCNLDLINSIVIKDVLNHTRCDGLLLWKPLLCDTEFVSKILTQKRYLPCQGCGCCADVMPISCPYHPEIGSEYFESQRRKIATRKEFCICGDGIVALYAAKKAAQRGFKVTICKQESAASQMELGESLVAYKNALQEELDALGIVYEEVVGEISSFLRERKPYFTIFLQQKEYDVSVEEAMFDLLDDRLSCVKFLAGKTAKQLEQSLLEVYRFFKQFYLA